MIAWVHSFRKWTWLTFAVGFAAAGWGLWSHDGNRLLVGSGLAAMIGVALLDRALAVGDIAIASHPMCDGDSSGRIRFARATSRIGDPTDSGKRLSTPRGRCRLNAAFRSLSTH